MKKAIESGLEIIGFSIIPLILTTDILFPVVVLIIKLLLYFIGIAMLLFGPGIIIKALRNKKRQDGN